MPDRRKPRSRKIGRILVLLLILVASILLARLILTMPYLKVSQVEVTGDKNDAPQIRQAFLGQSILFLPETGLRQKLTQNLLVESVSFQRKFPNRVDVSVTLRRAVLSWHGKSDWLLVDHSGMAYQDAKSTVTILGSEPEVPIFSANSDLRVGQRLSPTEIRATIGLIDLLSADRALIGQAAPNEPTISRITLSGFDDLVELPNGVAVTFDTQGDPYSQQQALQLILRKAKIEGKLPRTIDLRFSKTVVTY